MLRQNILTLVWAALTLSACGGSVATATQDASMDDGSAIDAAPEAPDGGRARVCPATLPEAGALCMVDRPQSGPPWPCEYGSDPHCTTVANCIQAGNSIYGSWQLTPPDALCNGNPAGCPSTFDTDAGANGATPCPTQDSCWYPEGSCACVSCQGSPMTICGPQHLCGMDAGTPGDASTWHCEPWPAPAGCPQPRPLLGSPCAVDPNSTCAYGPLCCGLVPNPQTMMQCTEGFWDTCSCGC